jgi:hypothetical protein
MPNFGLSVEALLKELEDRFPLVNPSPETQLNHILYRAGQHSVIEFIRERIKEP